MFTVISKRKPEKSSPQEAKISLRTLRHNQHNRRQEYLPGDKASTTTLKTFAWELYPFVRYLDKMSGSAYESFLYFLIERYRLDIVEKEKFLRYVRSRSRRSL